MDSLVKVSSVVNMGGWIIGVIIAQIFLSSNKNKFLGLNLPILSVIGLILTIFLTCTFENFSFGDIIYNIPTLMLLVIYHFAQKGLKSNNGIEKWIYKT